MATTLTKLLIHFVFSTKNRLPLITPDIEPRLHTYMSGIAKNHKSFVIAINGTEDHVHMLISLAKTMTVAELMENIKGDSSRWIKDQGAEFADFHWQEGYAAFSVGESAVEQVTQYIQNQKLHHRRTSYQEELVMFLKKYHMEYDERYIWT